MPRWRKQQRPSEPPPGSTFQITRLDAPPRPPLAAGAEQVPDDVCAARFRTPADVLTYVAAVRDEGADRQPLTRRSPDGALWVALRRHRPSDVELTWALGGVAHLPNGPALVSPRGHRVSWAELLAWQEVSLLELAAGVAPGTAVPEQPELTVVTTGSLARWIIDRFQSAELDIRIATARLEAIFRAGVTDWAAVLIRVTAHERAVPRSFGQALSGLPHTVVCRAGTGRLLVDQRLTLPLPDTELAGLVPDGQEWLLGGDLGAWRVTDRSTEQAPPLRAEPALEPPPLPQPGRLPADLRVEVRLVRDEQRKAAHALLLTDEELGPLRRFLTGHPAAERAFLVLGPDRHVFAEPGRSVTDIPFGVPLHRIGPGALYQEVGYRLKPALPGPARARLFTVDDQSLVVLWSGGTNRLALANTVPAWSLWLGPTVAADPAAEPLSAAAVAILADVDAAAARLDRPELAADAHTEERTGLFAEGFQLEQQGKLADAARKYWEAGQPALAARLYELAAEADQ